MTDAQLEGIAAQALNLAKRDQERGRFNFLLATFHQEDGALHRMTKIEALIIANLGEEWLNDGAAKDLGFGLLRKAVGLMPPDAIIFVTAANMFKPTEKMKKLPFEEQERRARLGHDENHRLAKQGYYEIIDCLIAVAQTPERVCHRIQPVAPRGQTPDAPHTQMFDQKHFDGRMKFYGEPSPECFHTKKGAQ